MEYSVESSWEMVSRKVQTPDFHRYWPWTLLLRAGADFQVNKPVPVSLNWLVLNLLHLYWALIQDAEV